MARMSAQTLVPNDPLSPEEMVCEESGPELEEVGPNMYNDDHVCNLLADMYILYSKEFQLDMYDIVSVCIQQLGT